MNRRASSDTVPDAVANVVASIGRPDVVSFAAASAHSPKLNGWYPCSPPPET